MRQFVRRVDELSGAMSGGLFRTDGGAMGGSSSGLDVSDIAEAWQRIRAGSAGEAWVLLETWLGSWAAGQLWAFEGFIPAEIPGENHLSRLCLLQAPKSNPV